MSMSRIFSICVFVLGLTLCGFSQARSSSPKSDNAPTITPTTGKIFVSFTITFASNIPSGDLISCGVSTLVFDGGNSNLFQDEAIRAGSRSGNTATCLVPIPYSWLLQTPGSDSITVDFDVSVGGTGSTPYPYRASSYGITIDPVPANGAVTNLSVNFTL